MSGLIETGRSNSTKHRGVARLEQIKQAFVRYAWVICLSSAFMQQPANTQEPLNSQQENNRTGVYSVNQSSSNSMLIPEQPESSMDSEINIGGKRYKLASVTIFAVPGNVESVVYGFGSAYLIQRSKNEVLIYRFNNRGNFHLYAIIRGGSQTESHFYVMPNGELAWLEKKDGIWVATKGPTLDSIAVNIPDSHYPVGSAGAQVIFDSFDGNSIYSYNLQVNQVMRLDLPADVSLFGVQNNSLVVQKFKTNGDENKPSLEAWFIPINQATTQNLNETLNSPPPLTADSPSDLGEKLNELSRTKGLSIFVAKNEQGNLCVLTEGEGDKTQKCLDLQVKAVADPQFSFALTFESGSGRFLVIIESERVIVAAFNPATK